VNATQPWNGGVARGENHDNHHFGEVGGASNENQSTREAVGVDMVTNTHFDHQHFTQKQDKVR
jgi:hypothetical protein